MYVYSRLHRLFIECGRLNANRQGWCERNLMETDEANTEVQRQPQKTEFTWQTIKKQRGDKYLDVTEFSYHAKWPWRV